MEMSLATGELRLQLGIEEDSQEYEGILSRIKAGNAILQDISGVHRELEPDRRRRSQSLLTKLLRGLFQSIYGALCNAIPSTCAHSHSIGLELAHRDAVILPIDMEEEIAERFDFRIALRTLETMQIVQPVNETQLTSHWKDFQLRLMRDERLPFEKLPLASTTLSLTSATPSPKSKVRWASLINSALSKRPRLLRSTTRSFAETSTSLQAATRSTGVPPPKVSDLCGIARRGPKAPAVNFYSYVLDTQRKFVLSHPNDDNGPRKHMTLRQVINRNIPGLPPLGFGDKLRLALALSVSVLHLDGTSWLTQIVTLDDIVFMIGTENTTNQRPDLLSRPFVIKNVPGTRTLRCTTPPNTPPTPTPSKRTIGAARPINLAVLSLGALLIHIMIERVDDGLWMTDRMDIGSIVSERERGSQLEEEVLVNGGVNYAAAVKWCLDSFYSVPGLQNDTFCQNFYEAVVARLEDDLEAIASDG
ncbi:hypothetical protein F5B21DRAFT_524331 [Xylaria acuta]|nr:hypothetical protein F5B21DRAFT_524331 [Xylaria acuta]